MECESRLGPVVYQPAVGQQYQTQMECENRLGTVVYQPSVGQHYRTQENISSPEDLKERFKQFVEDIIGNMKRRYKDPNGKSFSIDSNLFEGNFKATFTENSKASLDVTVRLWNKHLHSINQLSEFPQSINVAYLVGNNALGLQEDNDSSVKFKDGFSGKIPVGPYSVFIGAKLVNNRMLGRIKIQEVVKNCIEGALREKRLPKSLYEYHLSDYCTDGLWNYEIKSLDQFEARFMEFVDRLTEGVKGHFEFFKSTSEGLLENFWEIDVVFLDPQKSIKEIPSSPAKYFVKTSSDFKSTIEEATDCKIDAWSFSAKKAKGRGHVGPYKVYYKLKSQNSQIDDQRIKDIIMERIKLTNSLNAMDLA